jgi:hypothetical protein
VLSMAYSLVFVARWPRELRSEPGIYEMIALDDAGNPKPLSRIGGIDGGGVLFIGQGRKLRKRLELLRRGLFQDRTVHLAAKAYNENSVFQNAVRKQNIGFRFEHCEDHEIREKERIYSYVKSFGELPPLNAPS